MKVSESMKQKRRKEGEWMNRQKDGEIETRQGDG